MAQTATQKNPGPKSNVATGRFLEDATAAAVEFTLGFTPRYVRVVNVTSGDSLEWFEGMAAASAVKVTASTGVVTIITTLGITVADGKFTLGLDLDVNVADEQLSWIALA